MDVSNFEVKKGNKLIIKIINSEWEFLPNEEVEKEQEKIRNKFCKVIDLDEVLFIFSHDKDNIQIISL